MKQTRLKLLLTTGLAAVGLNLTLQPAHAATTSGMMAANETWSGIVTLTGDVTVPANVTLTILPGTRVECWDKADDTAGGLNTSRIELIINQGVLNAVGASNSPILFTSAPLHPPALAGDWYGIRLKAGTNGTSILRYCTVEFGNQGLRVEGGQPTIGHCLFRTNSVNGLFFGVYGTVADCSSVGNGTGIGADSGGCKVSRCFAVNNQVDGVHGSNLPGGPSVTIEDSQITGNSGNGALLQLSVGGSSPTQIYKISNTLIANNGNRGIHSEGQLFVNNCVITNNFSHGIAVSEYFDVVLTVSDCLLEQNGAQWQIDSLYGVNMTNTIIRNSRGLGLALRTQNGITYIKDSSFYNNGGGGLEFGGVPAATILKCVIRNNAGVGIKWGGSSGLSISDSSVLDNTGAGLDLGTFIAGGSSVTLKGNNIQGNQVGLQLGGSGANISGITSNKISGNVSYEIRNSGSAAIIATNNFWGEPTTTELANNVRDLTKVYDSQDNASVGQVILQPYLAIDPFAKPPILDTNTPADVVAAQGASATFTVTASPFPLAYQWRKGTSNLANQTNGFLTLNPVQPSDAAANYNVVVSNDYGAVTSRLATLTVLIPPSITIQPTNLFLPAGATAAFHVTATGSAPLGYQWQKGNVNLANGGRISGAFSPDLTITTIQAADATNYHCVVTNSVGTATSTNAWLALPTPPTITTNPATQVVGLGGAATFNVAATGSLPLSYQWYLNGSAIGGANGASLSIPATTADWLGSYQVQVWNVAGTNWSATAGLWLDALKMYAGVNVYGPAGSNCVVQYATNLAAPVTWTPLQSVTIVTNPTVIIDYDSPGQPKRFYRTLPQ